MQQRVFQFVESSTPNPTATNSPQTTDARWLPIHLSALSSTHRWRIPLDSAVESQQFRSHRRSTFFEIYGYVTPYTRRPLACRARRNERDIPSVTPYRLRVASGSSANRKASGVDGGISPVSRLNRKCANIDAPPDFVPRPTRANFLCHRKLVPASWVSFR